MHLVRGPEVFGVVRVEHAHLVDVAVVSHHHFGGHLNSLGCQPLESGPGPVLSISQADQLSLVMSPF